MPLIIISIILLFFFISIMLKIINFKNLILILSSFIFIHLLITLPHKFAKNFLTNLAPGHHYSYKISYFISYLILLAVFVILFGRQIFKDRSANIIFGIALLISLIITIFKIIFARY